MKGKILVSFFAHTHTHDVKIGEVQQNRFTGMPGFLTLAWGPARVSGP